MKTLDEVMAELPAGRRKKIEKRVATLVAEEMTLRELRKARKVTQVQLAKKLGVKQEQSHQCLGLAGERKRSGTCVDFERTQHLIFHASTVK